MLQHGNSELDVQNVIWEWCSSDIPSAFSTFIISYNSEMISWTRGLSILFLLSLFEHLKFSRSWLCPQGSGEIHGVVWSCNVEIAICWWFCNGTTYRLSEFTMHKTKQKIKISLVIFEKLSKECQHKNILWSTFFTDLAVAKSQS